MHFGLLELVLFPKKNKPSAASRLIFRTSSTPSIDHGIKSTSLDEDASNSV